MAVNCVLQFVFIIFKIYVKYYLLTDLLAARAKLFRGIPKHYE